MHRQIEDERLTERIRELHEANYLADGSRRMWVRRFDAPARTSGANRVARLMRNAGIQGAKRRGKPWRTTRRDPAARSLS